MHTSMLVMYSLENLMNIPQHKQVDTVTLKTRPLAIQMLYCFGTTE